MNEDYCDYKLSLALKACGFDEPCDKWIASKSFSYYDEDECCDHNAVIRKGWLISQKQKDRYDKEALPYLSLWHAQKWLREKHKWHIVIEPRIWEQQVYDYKLWGFMRGYENANRGFDYLSYEQALSAGISAALELIKKGE